VTYRVPASADQVLVSVNPLAGRKSRRRRVDELVERLGNYGLGVRVETDLAAIAQRAEELDTLGKLRAVVAAGGDGTVGELLNRLQPEIPIATLAAGTENLLAQYLGMARGTALVARAIADGRVVRLDAGRANGRWFSLMLSCGLDVEIVNRLALGRHGNIHHLSYISPIIRACREYSYPEFRIYSSADETPPNAKTSPAVKRARFVQFVNVPRYAFHLHFVPEASATDGLGHVCTFPGGGFWTTLGYYTSTWLGRQRRWTDLRICTAQRIRIECDQPAKYQLDGDPGGPLPVEVEIVPRRLAVIVPQRIVGPQ
jgi:diacylglycerol kinase family enzyme